MSSLEPGPPGNYVEDQQQQQRSWASQQGHASDLISERNQGARIMDDLRPLQEQAYQNQLGRSTLIAPTRILLLGLVVLAAVQVYTFVQIGHLKTLVDESLTPQPNANASPSPDIEKRLSALERAYHKSMRGGPRQGQNDLADVRNRVDSAQVQVKQNASAVRKLRAETERSAEELGEQLGGKADLAQVGMLAVNVSATRKDLASTNKKLQDTIDQLGMARSQLGTLIARNHGEIEKLRELGERDYFEFTLYRSAGPQPVGAVRLRLRKTDLKHLRYTLDIYADDYRMEEKGRGIDQPIFFYVRGSNQPVELVVNDVQTDRVAGYVSALKGTMRGYSLANPDWEPFQEIKRRSLDPVSHSAAGLPPTGPIRPN
jgi:hypothetical protein